MYKNFDEVQNFLNNQQELENSIDSLNFKTSFWSYILNMVVIGSVEPPLGSPNPIPRIDITKSILPLRIFNLVLNILSSIRNY